MSLCVLDHLEGRVMRTDEGCVFRSHPFWMREGYPCCHVASRGSEDAIDVCLLLSIDSGGVCFTVSKIPVVVWTHSGFVVVFRFFLVWMASGCNILVLLFVFTSHSVHWRREAAIGTRQRVLWRNVIIWIFEVAFVCDNSFRFGFDFGRRLSFSFLRYSTPCSPDGYWILNEFSGCKASRLVGTWRVFEAVNFHLFFSASRTQSIQSSKGYVSSRLKAERMIDLWSEARLGT